jgi:hypothetical protein
MSLFQDNVSIRNPHMISPKPFGADSQILNDLAPNGPGNAVQANGISTEELKPTKRGIPQIHLKLSFCPEKLDSTPRWSRGSD